jgi:lipopolysaccharide cholinephosphotransferase
MAIQEYKSEINELQKIQLSMLKDFDAVCQKHRISYQLFSGTALGAVRHKGFIPWDDDIDVVMLREDYERFFDSASKELDSNKYYVQREFSEHWPMFFSKLRLNGTTYIEKYHSHDARIHQGIYIDIFPCDNLSDSRLMQKLQYIASKIVIAKSLYARGYETNSTVKKCFMQFCRILPTEPFKRLCIRRNDSSSLKVHTFFGGGKKFERSIYLREWFEQSVKMRFEDSEFPVSAHYDEMLRVMYGDYMIMPTLEQRVCKRHAAIVDINKPYTFHLEEQRNMKIEKYTESIR